jgi:hypothetical protein
MNSENDGIAAIIAVPFDAMDELEREGLASRLAVFRGSGIEALVTVGMDSAALVTLLQAPDSIRSFAAWIHARFVRSGEAINISAKRGNRQIHLTVDGDIDVRAVADFLAAALADRPPHA